MMPARRLGTLAHIPDTSALYRDHKRLMFKLAGKYSAYYGLEMSDLISAGNETFLKCMKRWDPMRGKFSTYLHISLTNSFNNFVKKEKKEPCSAINLPEEMMGDGPNQLRKNLFRNDHETPFHDPLWLQDVVSSLSDDAREVVALLFDGDLGPTVSDHPVYVRAALKRALGGEEWSGDRIGRAFRNITRTLSK